ncbi:MAG: tetratricopeptide repeat protein [Rhodoferax sp.]|nr:tetratricopeptide repeat protein [Rhodoferax sp.]
MRCKPRRIFVALSLLAACTGVWGAETNEPVVDNSALSAELFYELLVSEISAGNGDTAAAYALMLDAARKSGSPRLYERAVEVALFARNGESALLAAQAWVQAQPASMEARRYQLQILIGLNKQPEIVDSIRRSLDALPARERQAFISLIPRFFVRASDRKQAADLVERALTAQLIVQNTGPAAWATVGRMRAMAGDAPGALRAAQQGAAMNQQSTDPIFLALDLMQPSVPAAEELVRNYLATKPVPELRMSYARRLMDGQRYAETYQQMLSLTTEKPDFADGWLVRGSLEVQDRKFVMAEASLKSYLALLPASEPAHGTPEAQRGQTQAYLLLSQVAEQTNRLDEAIAWLDKLETVEDAMRVQTRRAMILARQGKMDEAIALIRGVPESKPEDARTKVSIEVQLLRENKRNEQAFEVLSEANQAYPEDADLLYDQAMIAEKLGKMKDMEALLRRVISIKPDYHHAYNALGYSMADRRVNLPEARQLVTKALEFAPNDPFILDSMAWVEFRSGNADEALRLLQLAYKSRPDAEIAAHMGEVLWTLGQREPARAIWNEGKALNPLNETLLETVQRFSPTP